MDRKLTSKKVSKNNPAKYIDLEPTIDNAFLAMGEDVLNKLFAAQFRPLQEKTTRLHSLFNKDDTVKTDKRFKIYRKKRLAENKESFMNEVLELKKSVEEYIDAEDRQIGTDKLTSNYKKNTPGQ